MYIDLKKLIITNLKDGPQYKQDTINLIEREFNYSKPNSFEEDFYPLMCADNSKNCHIVLSEDKEVIAHIGTKLKELHIGSGKFEVLFIGGVCVSKKYSGQGVYSYLYKYIYKHYSNYPFYCLWSDKIDFYKKYNYFPCLSLYQSPGNEAGSKYLQISPDKLTNEEKSQIRKLYETTNEIRVNRNNKDWEEIFKITSSNLFIYRDTNKIIDSYYFIDKGQDLTGIIHEYDQSFLEEIKTVQCDSIWSSQPSTSSITLYGTLLHIRNIKLFIGFIEAYTAKKVKVRDLLDGNISFEFNKVSYNLSQDAFLQGIFGPNNFEEMDNLNFTPLYFCGLDTI